jgi:hypothetical protein
VHGAEAALRAWSLRSLGLAVCLRDDSWPPKGGFACSQRRRHDQKRQRSVAPPPARHHGDTDHRCPSSRPARSARRAPASSRTPRANNKPAPTSSAAENPHDNPADAKPSDGGSNVHGLMPGAAGRSSMTTGSGRQNSTCSRARTNCTDPNAINPAAVPVSSTPSPSSSSPPDFGGSPGVSWIGTSRLGPSTREPSDATLGALEGGAAKLTRGSASPTTEPATKIVASARSTSRWYRKLRP